MTKTMNYTKGEWKVYNNWPFPDQEGRTGSAVYNTINKTDMLICELVHSVDVDNREANSRLISAAPDMYEVLRTITEALAANEIARACRVAQSNGISALLKAEGK